MTGVFDLEDLIFALRQEDCLNLIAIEVDEEIGYVDHFVIGTCKSSRHLRATAEFIRSVYKIKKDMKQDGPTPKLEGELTDSTWIAVDLGKESQDVFVFNVKATNKLPSPPRAEI